jgi:ubiquinone/menaquinone biosynthesis C-methylase UbiE
MPVDLENLAAGYAHRPSSPQGLARAGRAARSVGLGPGDIAVDVGGGRGAHAGVWADLGAKALVLDPSRGMAAAARHRSGVIPVRAIAQQLPLRSAIVSLVYFHLSIHYGDWKRSLDEALRVLHPGGKCWIWTMGEEHHRSSFLARWFPSVGDIDAARFPPPEEIVSYLAAASADVKTGREVEHKEMTAGAWRSAVEARFVSTLQLISDDEYRSGLVAFDETYPDPDAMVDYVLTFDWMRATR